VGHNKQISGELSISFVKIYKIYQTIFFIIQRNSFLMYHKFEYKLQKSTLITFTRWLPWRKK